MKKYLRFALGFSIAILVLILVQWKVSGAYLPLGRAKPGSEVHKVLVKQFPGVSERAINSALMQCNHANWLDLGSSEYQAFIDTFKDLDTYRAFQASGRCP